jgi:hypothetical protein
MPIYEIEYAGTTYEVEAQTMDQAEEELGNFLGEQAGAQMLPGPDIGTAAVKQENVFGDVASEAMEQPLEALKAYRQRAADPERNLLQRAGDVAMTGLSGLSAGLSGTAGLIAELVAGDKTQERKLARDLIMGLEVAVPELAGPTSTLARLGRQVKVGQLPISRREIGEVTPRMESARSAEELGVLPSAGMQGSGAAMLEAGFEASPFSTAQIQRGTERVVSEIKDTAADVAQKAGGPTSQELAGEALQRGAKKFVSNFAQKSETLYNQLDKFIKQDDLIIAPNTTEALREIVLFAGDNPVIAQEIGLGRFQKLLSALGEQGVDSAVPYQLVKELRTTFGEAIGNISGPLADMSQGKIKRLYGTLSKDLEEAAKTGGPEAYKAWKRANDFYRGGSKRIDETLSKVTGADGGTAAYRRIENLLLEGNVKQSTNQIMQLKKSLPTDDFNTFKSTLISRLGRAKPGAQSTEGDRFSPATFLTNYNRMSPTSRKVVFGGLDPELKKLASVVEMSKDAVAQFNTSRTAPALTSQAILAGLGSMVVSPSTMIGIYVANKAGAAVMTNKTFLKALNAAAKKDMGPLQRLAGGDGFIAAEANTLLRTLAAQQTTQ